jgi:hypothetical protein
MSNKDIAWVFVSRFVVGMVIGYAIVTLVVR